MNASRLRAAMRNVTVPVIAFAFGMSLGVQCFPRPAWGSGAGRVVPFASAINGKLDTYPPAPRVRYKVVASEDGVDFSATRVNGLIKRHRHDRSAEFFYVVNGSGTVTIGNTVNKVVPGDMIVIPKSVPHSIAVGSKPLDLVEIDAPSMSLEDIHWMP